MRLGTVILCLVAVALVGIVVLWPRPPAPRPGPPAAPAEASEPTPPTAAPEPIAPPEPEAPQPHEPVAAPTLPPPPPAPVNKAERLARIRDDFRLLAAGDPRTALHAAHQLTDETERETALLALVTEWKHGELSSPRRRAWAIASFGLEGGLALELAGRPDLLQAWSAELNDAQTPAVAPEHLGRAMVDADPASAFAFSTQLSPADRRKFVDAAFAALAFKDTETALQWADQFSDPAEREAALKAIRSVAPVGIGVELRISDGYPVVGRMMPGSPAELSGQIHAGDRILAVAQGDNAFVDSRGVQMSDLVQKIRGTPGTLIQLQILPADAPAGSTPRTVTLVRDQVKMKR